VQLDMPVDLIVKPYGDFSSIALIAKKKASGFERAHPVNA
jgi:hypothetical protein